MSKILKKVWLVHLAKYLLFLLCALGVWAAQTGFDQIWIYGAYERRVNKTTLPVDVNRHISLGFDNMLADLHWLDAIQYLALGTSQGGHPALPILLDNVTTLDPDFEYPYIFSSLIMPGEGHTKDAIKLAEKGIKEVPNSWQIPYYAGLSIYQIQLRDYDKAAELVKLASTKPDAPESLSFISGVLRSRANDKIKAYASWEVIYNTAENKYSKERAGLYLEHYEIIFGLEKLCATYKEKYGSFPEKLSDLTRAGYIKEIPEDPLGRGFTYKKEIGEVFTDNSRRFGNQE